MGVPVEHFGRKLEEIKPKRSRTSPLPQSSRFVQENPKNRQRKFRTNQKTSENKQTLRFLNNPNSRVKKNKRQSGQRFLCRGGPLFKVKKGWS